MLLIPWTRQAVGAQTSGPHSRPCPFTWLAPYAWCATARLIGISERPDMTNMLLSPQFSKPFRFEGDCIATTSQATACCHSGACVPYSAP